MKVSIITVVKNNVCTVKHAIESVLSQTYNNIEYIVIDGASTDGTYEIVAWQEKFGSKRVLSQSVTVKSGSAEVNFEFKRPSKK